MHNPMLGQEKPCACVSQILGFAKDGLGDGESVWASMRAVGNKQQVRR